MKETTLAPRTEPTLNPAVTELIPFAGLLILASLLALGGGLATSVLFFGLLLVFSLSLLGLRHFAPPQAVRVRSDQHR